MYTKDKSNRITLRLSDDQFNFVKKNADILEVSPSEFLRMVINATIATTQETGGMRRENEPPHKYNII